MFICRFCRPSHARASRPVARLITLPALSPSAQDAHSCYLCVLAGCCNQRTQNATKPFFQCNQPLSTRAGLVLRARSMHQAQRTAPSGSGRPTGSPSSSRSSRSRLRRRRHPCRPMAAQPPTARRREAAAAAAWALSIFLWKSLVGKESSTHSGSNSFWFLGSDFWASSRCRSISAAQGRASQIQLHRPPAIQQSNRTDAKQ